MIIMSIIIMNNMMSVNDNDMIKYNVMFSCYRLQEIPYTLKRCQLIQQRLLAAECRVFGDNSAVEFHKLRHGIW